MPVNIQILKILLEPRASSSYVCVFSRSVVSDSLRSHGLQPGSSVHEDSPGKNTGMGCHFLLHHLIDTLIKKLIDLWYVPVFL